MWVKGSGWVDVRVSEWVGEVSAYAPVIQRIYGMFEFCVFH